METFVLNSVGTELGVLVKGVMDSNKGYFRVFNRDLAEDAMSDAYVRLLQHNEMTNITAYVKKLAQVFSKGVPMEYTFSDYESDDEDDGPSAVERMLFVESNIDVERLDYNSERVQSRLRDLYLMHSEDFVQLGNMFREGFDVQRSTKVRNPKLRDAIFGLCSDYGTSNVMQELYLVLRDIESKARVRIGAPVRTLQFRAKDNLDIRAHLDPVSIVLPNGKTYGIHPWRFTMDVNPDVVKWDVSSGRTIDVMRVDYTPLLDYLYEQVYAEPGVDTRHIRWCGTSYKLISPAGREFLNMDKESFFELVKQELFEAFIDNHLAPIVAISPDYIYIQPKHTLTCDILRVTLATGRSLDLPVDCYMRKR